MERNRAVIGIVLLILVILGGIYLVKRNPDSSGIMNSVYADWEQFSDLERGVSFMYPRDLSLTYVTPVDWPPQVQIIDQQFSCTEAGVPTDRAGGTTRHVIDGDQYCVTEVTDGAAGSIYTQYAYAFPHEDKTAIFTFTLRRVQCGNYDEPEQAECADEQNSFEIDELMGRIVDTLEVSEQPTNTSPNPSPMPSPAPAPVPPPAPAPPVSNACTMEAKLCPDGSYVGRSGPNCEFAPCPGE